MKSIRGISLIELMVAMAIGLVLVLALTIVIARSSASQRELAQANRQLENGRYAMQVLTDELHNAGFVGALAATPVATKLPAICGKTAASYQFALSPGVFAFPASEAAGAGCIDAANYVAGTDALMVIRADSNIVNWPLLDSTVKPADASLYLQSDGQKILADVGGGTFNLTQQVCPLLSNKTRPATCLEKDKVVADADIRRLHVSLFYVSPCNRPKSGNYADACDVTADDGRPVPTLRRLDLVDDKWVPSPVAEGIENLQFELGLDESGTLDGAPDNFLAAKPTLAQMINTVAVGVHLLAVNSDPVAGYKDDKSYNLGTTVVAAKNDAYHRHVFSRTVRLNNAAGRRVP